jgi:glucose-1-phosphate thymidylyltransferase
MWGIIPAAGVGSRIQPLAFSKELLPVGSRRDGPNERPRAVSEYLVERMALGGARKVCFVISPGKGDILEYYGGEAYGAEIVYAVQPRPAGLCDAIFRALPAVGGGEEAVLVGLPDTVWFPAEGFRALGDAPISFLLFPVERPELFDAVLTDERGRVREVQVKRADAGSRWIWGAFKVAGSALRELHELWLERERRDEYLGTLVNEWIARGGVAVGVRAGTGYVDVGTLGGYREAIGLLAHEDPAAGSSVTGPGVGHPAPAASPRPPDFVRRRRPA